MKILRINSLSKVRIATYFHLLNICILKPFHYSQACEKVLHINFKLFTEITINNLQILNKIIFFFKSTFLRCILKVSCNILTHFTMKIFFEKVYSRMYPNEERYC